MQKGWETKQLVVSLMRMQMKISRELRGNLVVAVTMRVPPVAFPVTAQVVAVTVTVNLFQVVKEQTLSTAWRGGAVEEVLKGVVEELGVDVLEEVGGDVLAEVGGDMLVEMEGDMLVEVGGDLPREDQLEDQGGAVGVWKKKQPSSVRYAYMYLLFPEPTSPLTGSMSPPDLFSCYFTHTVWDLVTETNRWLCLALKCNMLCYKRL